MSESGQNALYVKFVDEETGKQKTIDINRLPEFAQVISNAADYIRQHTVEGISPLDVLAYYIKDRYTQTAEAQPTLMFWLIARQLGYKDIYMERITGKGYEGKMLSHSWNVQKPNSLDHSKDTVWDPRWNMHNVPYEEAMESFRRRIKRIPRIREESATSNGMVARIGQLKNKLSQQIPSKLRNTNTNE